MSKKKSSQLGMSFGSASHRLRKMIMFELVRQVKKDICYRCGKIIDDIGDFSIEHIEPWQDSDSPKERFFNLDNIAFSHLKCNAATANNSSRIRKNKSGHKWIYHRPNQPNKPWVVCIRFPRSGTKEYLGSFAELDEAVDVKMRFLKRNPQLKP